MSLFEWATGWVNDLITFGRVVIVAVAIFGVISTYWLTKALVPVLSALLVAAIAIWAVSPAGLTTLEGWIGNETAAPAVLEQRLVDVDATGVDVV